MLKSRSSRLTVKPCIYWSFREVESHFRLICFSLLIDRLICVSLLIDRLICVLLLIDRLICVSLLIDRLISG